MGMLLWWSCQSPVLHSCSLLNHLNSFHGGMFKLNAKSDADSLLYSLSHFECDGHTVHMLRHLLPPLTSTVKSSLFVHADCSPLSLAARLHRHWADHSVILTTAGLFLDRSRHIQIQVWCRLEDVLLHKEPNSFPGNKGLWEIHRFQRTFSCYKSLKC